MNGKDEISYTDFDLRQRVDCVPEIRDVANKATLQPKILLYILLSKVPMLNDDKNQERDKILQQYEFAGLDEVAHYERAGEVRIKEDDFRPFNEIEEVFDQLRAPFKDMLSQLVTGDIKHPVQDDSASKALRGYLISALVKYQEYKLKNWLISMFPPSKTRGQWWPWNLFAEPAGSDHVDTFLTELKGIEPSNHVP